MQNRFQARRNEVGLFLCAIMAILIAGGCASLPRHSVVLQVDQPQTWTLTAKEDAVAAIDDDIIRLESNSHFGKNWILSAQASGPTAGLAAGDVLLLRLVARATSTQAESGKGELQMTLESIAERKSEIIYYPLTVSVGDWQRIDVPFRLPKAVPAGKVSVRLVAGGLKQTIEIRSLSLLRFGPDTPIETLPRLANDYAGRAVDAPWRKAAAERIERHRKSELVVTVVDEDGRPIPNAQVHIRQQQHRFRFGSEISHHLFETTIDPSLRIGPEMTEADMAKYQSVVPKHFNSVVPGMPLKHGWLHNSRRGTSDGDLMLEFAAKNGLTARGHVLTWGTDGSMRGPYKGITDPEVAREKARKHVLETTRRFRGKVYEWDVYNEPFYANKLTKLLGDDFLIDCFRWAREGDPDARLFINEFGILSEVNERTAQQAHLEKVIQKLLDAKAPLGGIGFQGHFSGQAVPPETMLRQLDRFGRFGLPILITEYDYVTPFEDDEADFFRDILTVAFSHPSVAGFYMWGFWDGKHWRRQSPMYDVNWRLKPSGQVFEQLVHGTWWTNEQLTTDETGTARLRAFHGSHEVTVEASGYAAGKARYEIGPEDGSFRMVLHRNQK